jgi:hypothetical protein
VAQSVAWPLRGDGGAATVDLEHAVAEIDGVVLRYGRFYDPGTYFEHVKPAHPRVHIDDAARRTVEALFMAEPGVLADRRVGFAPPLGTWGLAKLAIDVLDAENDWQEHRSFLEAIFEGDEGFEEWKRAHPHKLEPKA